MRAAAWLTLLAMLAGACNRPLRERPETMAASTMPRPALVQPGSHEEQITSGGANRHYILHVPEGYTGLSAVPLLLDFHGYGSNSRAATAATPRPQRGARWKQSL